MKIQIISRVDSSVLFEHDAENNTVRATLEYAIKAQADLYGANLSGAYLFWADLSGANLSGANLSGANLSGAYLSGADLFGEILDKAPISLINLEWDVLITRQYLRIGCKRYTHEKWRSFNDSEIAAMEQHALEFWSKW